MLNLDNALIVQSQAHIQAASEAFGAQGAAALRMLLDSVRLLFAARPPELITRPLTLIAPVGTLDADGIASLHGVPARYDDVRLMAETIGARPASDWLVAIAPDRSFRLVAPAAPIERAVLATHGVVYHRLSDVEWIAAGTADTAVLKLSPVAASAFADPTFNGLEDALALYGRRVGETACEILRSVWEGGADGPRLVLVNKPEHIMRESLFQALSLILRHADVTREHMVDADKPVDIRVSWPNSTAEALVEIKWIGRSMTAPGSQKPYHDFRPGRAQEGADQLANYLDLKRSSAPKQSVQGYLVVFDARRKRIQGPDDRLAKADAMHFELRELSFNPDHCALRADFKLPIRWFMRPRESDLLEAA